MAKAGRDSTTGATDATGVRDVVTPGRDGAAETRSGNARELLRRRLAAQWIVPPARPPGEKGPGIAEVVHHLLALQAQDFGQAVWAMGLRSPGATRADVAAALDGAQVVRSWPMRGTLHFSTPDDLRWMLSVTAPKTVSGVAARHRQLELDDAVFARAAEIARGELSGGGSFSRDEFFGLLVADGIGTKAQRGVHIIWRLAVDGLLCWGPTRGTQQALVLLDEWAPPARDPRPARDEALAEFVLRYLVGHGPATLKDFCWWSKTTVTDAQRGLAAVRDQLVETRIDGVSYWSRDEGEDDVGRGSRASVVQALPGFDEYLLGYQDRSHALPAAFADRIVPGNNGMFLPMIVSHGSIVGTWKRSVTPKRAQISVEPFTDLSRAERTGFARQVARYGRFLGVPASIAESADGDVAP